MSVLSILLYVIAALQIFGGLLVVAKVGESRKPYTGSSAVGTVIMTGFWVTITVLAAWKLK